MFEERRSAFWVAMCRYIRDDLKFSLQDALFVYILNGIVLLASASPWDWRHDASFRCQVDGI